MMLFLSIVNAHAMCSIAHSLQDCTGLQIGSPFISSGLPTDIGLLTSLSEYRGYRMVDKLHVETVCFS